METKALVSTNRIPLPEKREEKIKKLIRNIFGFKDTLDIFEAHNKLGLSYENLKDLIRDPYFKEEFFKDLYAFGVLALPLALRKTAEDCERSDFIGDRARERIFKFQKMLGEDFNVNVHLNPQDMSRLELESEMYALRAQLFPDESRIVDVKSEPVNS